MEKTMEEQCLAVLDKIRPYLQREGGDVELVDVVDGVVRVRVLGACTHCMSLDVTFSEGIEAWLLDEVPGIDHVELVNDDPAMEYYY